MESKKINQGWDELNEVQKSYINQKLQALKEQNAWKKINSKNLNEKYDAKYFLERTKLSAFESQLKENSPELLEASNQWFSENYASHSSKKEANVEKTSEQTIEMKSEISQKVIDQAKKEAQSVNQLQENFNGIILGKEPKSKPSHFEELKNKVETQKDTSKEILDFSKNQDMPEKYLGSLEKFFEKQVKISWLEEKKSKFLDYIDEKRNLTKNLFEATKTDVQDKTKNFLEKITEPVQKVKDKAKEAKDEYKVKPYIISNMTQKFVQKYRSKFNIKDKVAKIEQDPTELLKEITKTNLFLQEQIAEMGKKQNINIIVVANNKDAEEMIDRIIVEKDLTDEEKIMKDFLNESFHKEAENELKKTKENVKEDENTNIEEQEDSEMKKPNLSEQSEEEKNKKIKQSELTKDELKMQNAKLASYDTENEKEILDDASLTNQAENGNQEEMIKETAKDIKGHQKEYSESEDEYLEKMEKINVNTNKKMFSSSQDTQLSNEGGLSNDHSDEYDIL
ncbi:hypothetical protein [Lactococcus lactis]|uniref:hypothetical protein n=1 Tax=Lactococcus lactis TaxID=1358 RepID=UPI00288EE049|nr:hypothetical protein [Lactococcus lactis]MDT2914465.1 hypothetical protein [Lactococcus lactis]